MVDGGKHGAGGRGRGADEGGRDLGWDAGGVPMLYEAEQEVFILTRKAVRELDRLAVSEFGIPAILLMENAAFHIADLALHLTREQPGARILLVCGPGNNGGDGLAAARHLHNAGAVVEIVHAGGRSEEGEAAVNLGVALRMGLPITPVQGQDGRAAAAAMDAALARLGTPDLVIDAVLGTGLDRPVREPLATLIGRINELSKEGVLVVAVDIPSGLDADTGEPLGMAVRADVTVTLAGLKAGFTKLGAQGYIGDVVVSDIGAPRELTQRLGTPLREHEPHESPPVRPGHEPATPEPEHRPDRG